jgi:putative CocE/NonD family hydrolase
VPRAIAGLLAFAVGVLAVAGAKNNIDFTLVASDYVTMRDGVRIAVTTNLPRTRGVDERLPVMLLQTRYHRAQDLRFPLNLLIGPGPRATPLVEPFVRNGYAYVLVDVRGSGASFGTYGFPFSPQERADGVEILTWIARQPWSNGKVGTEGVSYNGTTAELLLQSGAPQVKAALPLFSTYDPYTEILNPGGLFADDFVGKWMAFSRALDRDQVRSLMPAPLSQILGGVRPVHRFSGDLYAALREHEANKDLLKPASEITFKDDTVDGFSALAMSPFLGREAERTSGAAIFSVSGWYDGGYANAAIKRFLSVPNPGSRLLIGPWSHGGRQIAHRCRQNSVPFDARNVALSFFNEQLKGIAPKSAPAPVTYYTLCAETWRTAATWPPKSQTRSLYLAAGNKLADAPDAAASDTYAIDPTATSGGLTTRWASYVNLTGTKTGYLDRAVQDGKLLTYTSEPLTTDTEVTGHPIVTLHVRADAPDAGLFVYLEDVDANGAVDYVTEGQLRALHRKLSTAQPPYVQPMPYRSFLAADAAELSKETPAEIAIDLLPVSYLFRQGHRIRISIAGADKDNFAPVIHGATQLQIDRGPALPSRIDLPVVPGESK